MNRICRRAVAAVGALALTGGTALAAAVPASAQVNPDNYSYGASTEFGGPLALAQNTFGQHVVQKSSFSLFSHLVSGGNMVDTAFNSGASSSVALVNVRSNLAALGLKARVVHSSCNNSDGVSGQTTILGGVVGVGGFGQPVDTNPYVDEPVYLPGGITVLLNDQSNNGDFLTVNAMLIEVPGGQEITVGTSVCEEDN